jgi:hypothetical protein
MLVSLLQHGNFEPICHFPDATSVTSLSLIFIQRTCYVFVAPSPQKSYYGTCISHWQCHIVCQGDVSDFAESHRYP